jgi:polar amino acid transport system substrate-binding protein
MKRMRVFSVLTLFVLVMGLLAGCIQPPPSTPGASAPGATQATGSTAGKPGAGKKFVLASDAVFPPMEFVDDNKNIVGFDIDLITAIASDQGFEFEIKNTAWDGIFAGLKGNAYDAILSSVTITDDRKREGDFSDPYITVNQAIVVRADETRISGPQDLAGKTVGAQIETTGAIEVRKIQGVTLKQHDSPDLGMLDLANRNVDAFVVDRPVAADFALQSAEFKGKLKIAGEIETNEFYGVMVNKGDPKGFLRLFNDGLKNVKASGEYDRIYAKWIGGTSGN